jgi:hypothetical protein
LPLNGALYVFQEECLKSYFIVIILIFFSFHSAAADNLNCSESEIFTGKLFQLNIKYSFKGEHEYQFCVGEESSFLISKFIERLGQNLPDLTHTSQVKLTAENAEKLKRMYQNTVVALPKDTSAGMDGSTWCFKPKSGLSYSKFCYWSPEANTAERKLTKLYNLKLHIEELSGLK